MELTHAGRAFLPYAERALDALRGGAALVSELAEGVVGELAIGAAPSVGSYVLPELLARYLERIPVVVVDGEEVCDFYVDEPELRRRLGRVGGA
jgi:DNA-binding transcriptional LysR family regulator